MTRDQALQQLKNNTLSAEARERIYQYIHYLDTEGVEPKSAKRPRHTRGRNDQTQNSHKKK